MHCVGAVVWVVPFPYGPGVAGRAIDMGFELFFLPFCPGGSVVTSKPSDVGT